MADENIFADAIVWEPPGGTPAPLATAVAEPEPPPDVAPGEAEAAPPEDEPGSEAEPVAPVEGEEPVAPDQPAGESRFQRRFSDLTHERDLARQEAQLLREQLDRERALHRPPVQEPPPSQTQAPPTEPFQRDQYGNPLLPPATQFPTQEAYEQAFVAWHREDMRRAILADRQEQELHRTVTEMRTRYPDFDQVMQGRPLYISPVAFQALGGMGREGLEVAYHLRRHPELQAQYATQTGNDAVMAMMRLAIQLENARQTPAPTGPPAPLPPRVSQAPPPITRTRATGSVPPVDLETIDIMDFIQARDQQERERRRRM